MIILIMRESDSCYSILILTRSIDSFPIPLSLSIPPSMPASLSSFYSFIPPDIFIVLSIIHSLDQPIESNGSLLHPIRTPFNRTTSSSYFFLLFNHRQPLRSFILSLSFSSLVWRPFHSITPFFPLDSTATDSLRNKPWSWPSSCSPTGSRRFLLLFSFFLSKNPKSESEVVAPAVMVVATRNDSPLSFTLLLVTPFYVWLPIVLLLLLINRKERGLLISFGPVTTRAINVTVICNYLRVTDSGGLF